MMGIVRQDVGWRHSAVQRVRQPHTLAQRRLPTLKERVCLMSIHENTATISRRSLLGTAGMIAAGSTLGLGLTRRASARAEEAGATVSVSYVDTIKWDTEYDVVVIGWGGAGSVTAITAAENGAKVLITEKAPYGDEGGNTRYCEQYAYTPASVEDGIACMKAFAEGFDTATDEIIEYMAQGAYDNIEWILNHGAETFGLAPQKEGGQGDAQVAWPDFRELETWTSEVDGKLTLSGEFGTWPNGEPNNGRMIAYQVNAPDSGEKKYWKLMRKNVVDMKDAIDVWYESPATKLIQDPFTKTILGVTISRNGADVNVRALNGVVLTCGSYEASEEMLENYAQISCGLPLGTLYNTGDGIKMAIEVGADLWHMDALSGPWPTPRYHDVRRGIFGGIMTQRITTEPSCFYVGGNAKRFMKESDWHKHGHINVGGTWISQNLPDTMWAIMDDTARNGSGVISYVDDEEVIEAASIKELAEAIELDPETLATTLDEYNAVAEAKSDPFGRPDVALAPLTGDKFYAVRLWPCFVNCQGGPRRNTNCEVLDTHGNPIPHLYSAGELGSFWAGVYSGGGNIAETMYTGRTAGANAAAVKEEPAPVELATVESAPAPLGNDLDTSEAQVQVDLGENEYLGVGEGLHGAVYAKVTVVDGKPTAIEVISQSETADITEEVWSTLPDAIVAAGSTNVDGITGATLASDGLKAAVEDALAQA